MTAPAVHLIVFSKDRPLQLHGYLTSLFEQWQGTFDVDVLLRGGGAYEAAYDGVANEVAGRAAFHGEADFAGDLQFLLKHVEAPLTCFGCDDAVFTQPVDADQLPPLFEEHPKLLGISLRLGSTVKRGMWGHEMAQPRFMPTFPECPQFVGGPAGLEWDCTAIGSAGDWAYPWDVVGTVYRTDFVRRMVHLIHAFGGLTNPNLLEYHGSCRWQEEAQGATLLRAWYTPRLVLPTINVVQSVFPNGTVGQSKLDPAFLLECWNRGLRLDTQRYATGPQPDTWRTGDLYLRRAG